MTDNTEKKPDRYVLYDNLTGKVVRTFKSLTDTKNKQGKGFFMLWNTIIQDERVSKADKLLFLHLCTMMEEGGWIAETQKTIAKQLKLDISNVNKAMSRLQSLDYIQKVEHKGSLWFKINSEHAYKGKLLFREVSNAKVPPGDKQGE